MTINIHDLIDILKHYPPYYKVYTIGRMMIIDHNGKPIRTIYDTQVPCDEGINDNEEFVS